MQCATYCFVLKEFPKYLITNHVDGFGLSKLGAPLGYRISIRAASAYARLTVPACPRNNRSTVCRYEP